MKFKYVFGLAVLVWSLTSCRPPEKKHLLRVPFIPPGATHPYVDYPFIQETNHTTNEVEASIGALVAVQRPPVNNQSFDLPIQITPRGIVRHNEAGVPWVQEWPIVNEDIQFSAMLGDRLVIASIHQLVIFSPESGFIEITVPVTLELQGLFSHHEQVYILTNQGVGRLTQDLSVTWPMAGPNIRAAAVYENVLYAGGDNLLAAFQMGATGEIGAMVWQTDNLAGVALGLVIALVTQVTLPIPIDLVVITSSNLLAVDVSGDSPALLTIPEFALGRVPLAEPTAAATMWDGGLIVTTRNGAYRLISDDVGPEWRVYMAERWLPANDVRGVATTSDQVMAPIYFATALGLATIIFEQITLNQKMEPFVQRVMTRHDRDGAVADSHLTTPGDLFTNIPWDSDNDGGWTCYWVLSECFRYRVTGDPRAKANFDRSLARMLSFRTLTGTEYFLARSVIRKQGCPLDDCDNPDDGEWFSSPDGEWWVKGDTSNDEITSHMFMMGPAYDLCADADQQQAIVEHVDGIVGGLVDHGFQLLDRDGLVTTYGQLDPHYVNDSINGSMGDGGRRSAQMLGALTLAFPH